MERKVISKGLYELKLILETEQITINSKALNLNCLSKNLDMLK